ncbi:MAG: ABC transporter permease [Pseudomonadota bacterium]
MDFFTIVQLGDASIRMAIPLLLACLAGLFSERAGIFDIGLEGKMLAAAFLSAAVSVHFAFNPLGGYVDMEVCDARNVCQMVPTAQHPIPPVLLGLLSGIAISVALSIVHGVASITFHGNQLISGVAINFLAAGLTVVIAQGWFAQGGRTPSLSGRDEFGQALTGARFEGLNFPGALERIRDIRQSSPGMQFYSELVSGHSILVYAAFLIVPLTWWILFRTRFGLRLRAVGENPAAVDTAGVSVIWLRYSAVVICGVLCGIAGAYLSTAVQAGFTKDMTANRGFIALAALIFAKWKPWPALWTCLLFGFFFALDNRFQNISVDLIWALAVLVGLAAVLIAYVARKELVDKLVLGGLAVVFLALALTAWLVEGSAEGMTMGAALWESVRIPSQLIQSLPYILVVVVLAGFVGKAIPPRAGGQPYVKER